MDLNKIAEDIKNTPNIYEEERGIKTISVVKGRRINEQIQLFLGFKQEESVVVITFFIALKRGIRSPYSNWWWFCPSKETIKDFGERISSKYFKVDKLNNRIRKKEFEIDMDKIRRIEKNEN